jgi:hypothetical protein
MLKYIAAAILCVTALSGKAEAADVHVGFGFNFWPRPVYVVDPCPPVYVPVCRPEVTYVTVCVEREYISYEWVCGPGGRHYYRSVYHPARYERRPVRAYGR